jgi:hypothetical protein
VKPLRDGLRYVGAIASNSKSKLHAGISTCVSLITAYEFPNYHLLTCFSARHDSLPSTTMAYPPNFHARTSAKCGYSLGSHSPPIVGCKNTRTIFFIRNTRAAAQLIKAVWMEKAIIVECTPLRPKPKSHFGFPSLGKNFLYEPSDIIWPSKTKTKTKTKTKNFRSFTALIRNILENAGHCLASSHPVSVLPT